MTEKQVVVRKAGLTNVLNLKGGRLALASGLGVGTFAGLVGLGGAELRMPVLMRGLGLTPQRAVPVNLCVSLVTLTVGAIARMSVLRADLPHLGGELVAVAAGAVLASWFASSKLHALSEGLHTKMIAALLLGVAGLMLFGLAHEPNGAGLAPQEAGLRMATGMGIGVAVGTVSAMFGVAGGQITIPALMYAFGLDIKLAGTASLLINLPSVGSAVARAARAGRFDAKEGLRAVALPMAAGSLVGAGLGGLLVGVVPANALRVLFAAVLAWAAWGMLRHKQRS